MSEAIIQGRFAETLRGDYEDEAPWDAVRELRRLGTREVFDVAAEWCTSDEPLKRARGVDVLAQLGKTAAHQTNTFPEESYSIVSNLLKHESNVRPLNSAISALGHLDNPAAVPLIAPFYSHENAEIRFSVAFALGCFPNDPLSVTTLLTLVKDSDEDVRDWATFGLGVLGDQDSSEIRDALVRALGDSNEDVREEALVALAKRNDIAALRPLLVALQEPRVTSRITEAAYTLLGMTDEEKDWSPQQYASALKERFASNAV
jgi:HEAT repeats